MIRRIMNTILRHGFHTAVRATTETAVTAASRSFVQVFEIKLPTTVYVRASQSDVTVRREPGNRVELSANLRASFGWELAAEQDDAGVYIVAKRKPIVGAISTARFTLTVPPEVNLIFHLTPGTIHLTAVDGKISIPGSADKP
jgi:hypothetical protein